MKPRGYDGQELERLSSQRFLSQQETEGRRVITIGLGCTSTLSMNWGIMDGGSGISSLEAFLIDRSRGTISLDHHAGCRFSWNHAGVPA
jgi:hypothetical protein